MSNQSQVLIYTDGACSGNPGPGGWAYLLKLSDEVYSVRGYSPSTTNNRMELQASIEALKCLSEKGASVNKDSVTLYTDSSYVLKGITEWIFSWKKNNWVKADSSEVLNKDLWIELDACVSKIPNLKWVWVRGHEGVKGNEWVDREAVAAYQEKTPVLVKWNLSDFPEPAIFLENPQQEKSSSVKTRSSKSNSSGKVFYVSYVEGELQRHSSWSECEKRVKGQSGAKFKKLKTEEELVALLRSWKVSAF